MGGKGAVWENECVKWCALNAKRGQKLSPRGFQFLSYSCARAPRSLWDLCESKRAEHGGEAALELNSREFGTSTEINF